MSHFLHEVPTAVSVLSGAHGTREVPLETARHLLEQSKTRMNSSACFLCGPDFVGLGKRVQESGRGGKIKTAL